MTTTRAALRIATVLVAVGLVAGCTDTPTEKATPEASGGPVVVDGKELTPAVEVTVPVPGDPDDEVTLGLVSLVAEGSTAELRLVMTPHFSEDVDDPDTLQRISVYDMFGGNVMPNLVDIGTATTYDVVSRNSQELSTDVVRATTPNETPILYQAWFPRPKGDPETVDVWLHASWPDIEDVPVTYED